MPKAGTLSQRGVRLFEHFEREHPFEVTEHGSLVKVKLIAPDYTCAKWIIKTGNMEKNILRDDYGNERLLGPVRCRIKEAKAELYLDYKNFKATRGEYDSEFVEF